MSTDILKLKRFLFVDDDTQFLDSLRHLFAELARGSWEILTAENHAQALAQLGRAGVDVVVLDIGMPVMDGIQFLRLLGRTHPGQQVVMLTSRTEESNRKACLDLGAALFLEKPTSPQGFEAVFAALDALAQAVPQVGFRGMMRRVGLAEVLQLECLGRKSSVLEVFTGKTRGRVFIADGSIVHAESGGLQGEVALYGLLALRGGEFNLLPFSEPPNRTISGQYEFLLMEAARLNDEASQNAAEAVSPEAVDDEAQAPTEAALPMGIETTAEPGPEAQIAEVLLCSGAGEVLYESGCASRRQRLVLLDQIERQAVALGSLIQAGRFDRLELLTRDGRIVAQIQPHMRLLVRSIPFSPSIP